MAVAPLLIVLMISSLANFLALVLYDGTHPQRVAWTLLMFTLGAVGIARVAIEENRAYSFGYAAVLGLVTFLTMMRFVGSPIFSLFALALIGYLADVIVRDCTIIDESVDASGEGLLDSAGAWSRRGDRASPGPETRSPNRPGKSKPHQPGRTVLYLALAALPLFGLGQFLLRGEASAWSRAQWLLGVYLFASLSLLVTTSFLGLRRYLRQRNVDMPMNVSVAWLAGGCLMVASIVALAYLAPMPGQAIASFRLPAYLETPEALTASRFGWGEEGAEKSSPDAAQTASDPQEASKEPAGTRAEQGAPAGDVGSGQRRDGPAGSESGGQQQGGSGDSGQSSSETSSSSADTGSQSDSSSESQASSGSQSQPEQSGSQSASSEAPDSSSSSSGSSSDTSSPSDSPASSAESGDRPSDAAGSEQGETGSEQGEAGPEQGETGSEPSEASGESRASSETAAEPGDSSGDERPESSGDDSPPEPESAESQDQPAGDAANESEPPQRSGGSSSRFPSGSLPGLSSLARAVIMLVLAAIVLVFLWRYRDAIMRWWEDLFSREPAKPPAASAEDGAAAAAVSPPRPFASFRNPIGTEADARRAVVVTFQAFEAWSREHGWQRGKEETPSEFIRRVARSVPEMSTVTTQLVDAYNRIVYGRGQATETDLNAASQLWQAMHRG